MVSSHLHEVADSANLWVFFSFSLFENLPGLSVREHDSLNSCSDFVMLSLKSLHSHSK